MNKKDPVSNLSLNGMQKRSPMRFFPKSAAVVAALAACCSVASGELIIGLTTNNGLTSFDSANPMAATAPIPITGLVAGDSVFGIDRRPTNGTAMNGLLYAFAVQGTTGRIYIVNELTGVAMLASVLNVAVSGNSFGVDFNPVPDRLRVVSDLNQNLRINVDTGATIVDGALAYGPGPNFGIDPVVTAAAYSNNFGGATSTTLRDVDSGTDDLVSQNPPNDGTLNFLLDLGVDFGMNTGYDISGLTGTPYFSNESQFYTISGGALSLIGTVGTGFALRGIAAPVGAPVPETLSALFSAIVILGTVAAGRFSKSTRKRA